ncbi:hypothetical protein FACS1894216_15310 [Synergistales bacterium]|nr:hypothetical protein FACS1894216_15310 [Synergistales bacterium]
MVRKVEREAVKSERKYLRRFLYCAAVAALCVVWFYGFKRYFEAYDSVHPDIVWALPWVQADEERSKGFLLWNESKLGAPMTGTVTFPSGRGPVRVSKGAVVGRVTSGRSASDVRAPQEGYFIAGLDGHEGKWRYALIWNEYDGAESAKNLVMLADKQLVSRGEAIGKLIPQPQSLRFVGYADSTEALAKQLDSKKLMVKMDELDSSSGTSVRVYDREGEKVKLYIDMPFFPPSVLLSRNYELIIETGSVSGVSVPASSVVTAGGVVGVFAIRGSDAAFTPVEGRYIDDGKFLATKGLKFGDAVIIDGDSAREGRVKLW